ncbi:recombination protein NinB [Xenorhabdus sp. TH1]|uniref:recombination protein NinB n=1 Tax=Xenorhabdus sp. TH1 TaxID=3130166 RepID=UPI0030D350F9
MECNFLFHESTKQSAWQQLKEVLATNQPHHIIIKPWKNTRSLSQNATMHMWFGEISRFLKSNGAKYSPDEVKEMMKHTFLGYEVVERIDAERRSRSASGHYVRHLNWTRARCFGSWSRLSNGLWVLVVS